MHEYPITVQIIKIAEKHADEAGAQRVRAINLVIGEYSGYIGEAVKMYFDIISEGTICEGAEINIENIKPKLKCQSCGELFERVANFSFDCPSCGGDGNPTDIGKEFYVKDIEIE